MSPGGAGPRHVRRGPSPVAEPQEAFRFRWKTIGGSSCFPPFQPIQVSRISSGPRSSIFTPWMWTSFAGSTFVPPS